MLNDPASIPADESLASTMQSLAGYIICNLNEVQNGSELTGLLNHADPEIRQEASIIYQEIRHLKRKLGQL